MLDRGKPEIKPIERSPKESQRRYFCIACGGIATKIAHFKIPGATIVERYCDACASKID